MRITLLIVFGAAGTLARYALQGFVYERAGAGFPSGTLAVNLIGCFVLGLFGQYALNSTAIPAEWRIGIMLGFLGAFTTFSTFGWETMKMLQGGEWLNAAAYVLSSVLGGVALTGLGMWLGGLR